MIEEGRETDQIDNITNTVAVMISGKAIEQQPKQSKNNSEPEETPEEKEATEKQAEILQPVKVEEPDEHHEARELSKALLQSAVDSYQTLYNHDDESALFCIRGMSNLGNT
mmetsp:Transcript_16469/g.19037  ORF Transcript_16469/g.19037 Transcript_16469/m.19037 type:complete len:111 (+) Transcript_16469:377-709(+)